MATNTPRFPAIPVLMALMLLLSACGGGGSGPAPLVAAPGAVTESGNSGAQSPPPAIPVADQLASLEGLEFTRFTEASFDLLLRRFPETAVSTGAPDVPLVLNDVSAAWADDTLTLTEGILAQLEAYPASARTEPLFSVYRYYLEDQIEGAAWRDYRYPASYFITSVPSDTLFFFTDIQPLATAFDARAYVERLRYVDTKFNQLMENVDAAADRGIVLPRIFLDYSINRHQEIATANTTSSPFYARFQSDINQIDGLTASERDNLLQDARTIISAEIAPAYQRLISQLEGQRPVAPTAIGVGQFPGGQDFYNYALKHHTTTDLTAEDIHTLGQQELDRIHAEMRSIFNQLGYPATDSISTSLSRAASDSGQVPADDVVGAYEAIVADAYERLPEAFNVLPQSRLVVIGGPTGGFYVRPTVDGSRPGAFYATNTRAEPVMPMKSLAYHEGVPGHHLQIALALEQADSLVQQYVTFTGFVEGWALYAERLAFELGWYADDPYGNLGRLQFEALRAARMVVDTGIHARGWSFEQAVDFFQQATGFSRGASEGNIGRYSLWPGQSTAYMVGMLEILRYRARLQTSPDFDLRTFHDQILTRGAVPLTQLELD